MAETTVNDRESRHHTRRGDGLVTDVVDFAFQYVSETVWSRRLENRLPLFRVDLLASPGVKSDAQGLRALLPADCRTAEASQAAAVWIRDALNQCSGYQGIRCVAALAQNGSTLSSSFALWGDDDSLISRVAGFRTGFAHEVLF